MAFGFISGSLVKILRNKLSLFDKASIISDTSDPTSVATNGNIGDLYIRSGTTGVFVKTTTNATDTNWSEIIGAGGSTPSNDISPTSITLANNAVSSVPGLTFNGNTYRAAAITYAIKRQTGSVVETVQEGTLDIYFRNATTAWTLVQNYTGDDVGVTFTMTSGATGSVQYTSTNYSGTSYVGVLSYRAEVLPV